MIDNLPIQIRLSTNDDNNFIIDSWTNTMKHMYPNQYALDFHTHYQNYVKSLIINSLSVVAHLENEPNEIISYLVYTFFRSSQVVHFAYTKLDARNQKILNRLIDFSNPEKHPVVFTHPAKNENIMHYLCSKYIYDPSIMSIQ